MAHASLDPFRLAFTEPSWDDLRIFLAVVAHGSMNGAARALGQSQPTIARRIKALEETLGYYGEELVLKAQELGLNTCWVALTHGKSKAVVGKGEKEVCLIALGYGAVQGAEHKSKPLQELCSCAGPMPEWSRSFGEPIAAE